MQSAHLPAQTSLFFFFYSEKFQFPPLQLFNDVLPDMHEKPDNVPAATDHTEILHEVAQQGLMGESSPERVQGQKMERKLF